jgi:catechol 2,3-dioxygenase-like lactoylglutathione lyase family enzyme
VRLTHIRLLVDDFPATSAFYREVLGLETAWAEEGVPYVELRADEGSSVAVNARDVMSQAIDLRPGGDAAALIFAVESVDAEAERLHMRGIAFESEPHDEPGWGVRVAHFRDPAGNLVEINEPLEP